jgi:hypothetical protein
VANIAPATALLGDHDMILALFASLFLAQPTTPPANGNAAANGASQPVTTEDQAEAAADAVEQAAEAVEEAGEAAEEATEAAAEVAESAAETAADAAEAATDRVCHRRNYYDEFGRRRSRKVCTAR